MRQNTIEERSVVNGKQEAVKVFVNGVERKARSPKKVNKKKRK